MTVDYDELRKLQSQIGEGNASRGFHMEGDRLREEVEENDKYDSVYGEDVLSVHARSNLRNYYSMKLGLIVTEAAEAIEELRNGRLANETYYPSKPYTDEHGVVQNAYLAIPYKPEGVPSEVADIVIRCFDFADEAGFDLAAIIEEKLAYNATRPFMHGGKLA